MRDTPTQDRLTFSLRGGPSTQPARTRPDQQESPSGGVIFEDIDRIANLLGSTSQLQAAASSPSAEAISLVHTVPEASSPSWASVPEASSPSWAATRDTTRTQVVAVRRRMPSSRVSIDIDTPGPADDANRHDARRSVSMAAGVSLERAAEAIEICMGDLDSATMLAMSGELEQLSSLASHADTSPEIELDDMSYEELLELQDSIGHVRVGVQKDELITACDVKRLCSIDMASLAERCNHLDPEAIQHDKRCSVCLNDYAKGEELAVTSCGHEFHLDCLCHWMRESRKCPLCLQEVDAENEPIELKQGAHAAIASLTQMYPDSHRTRVA